FATPSWCYPLGRAQEGLIAHIDCSPSDIRWPHCVLRQNRFGSDPDGRAMPLILDDDHLDAAAPNVAESVCKCKCLNERDRHLYCPGPKRILALDGGGVRGAITVAFLEQIEKV